MNINGFTIGNHELTTRILDITNNVVCAGYVTPLDKFWVSTKKPEGMTDCADGNLTRIHALNSLAQQLHGWRSVT